MTSSLRQAYDLISDPARWTKRAIARTSRGVATAVGDPDATRWCASGAVVECGATAEENAALLRAARSLFPRWAVDTDSFLPVVLVNDHEGHEAIMQVFEKAIVEMEGSL